MQLPSLYDAMRQLKNKVGGAKPFPSKETELCLLSMVSAGRSSCSQIILVAFHSWFRYGKSECIRSGVLCSSLTHAAMPPYRDSSQSGVVFCVSCWHRQPTQHIDGLVGRSLAPCDIQLFQGRASRACLQNEQWQSLVIVITLGLSLGMQPPCTGTSYAGH